MNTTELIAETRFAAQLPDDSQDYTDARIRSELTVTQRSIFAPSVVEAKSGALLKRFLQPTTAGTATYPLPSRAMAAGAETVEIYDSSGVYTDLEIIEADRVHVYESASRGRPRFFQIVGSSVRLFPTPDATYALRIHYYLRPSTLYAPQVATTTGQITNVDRSVSNAVTLTVASMPADLRSGGGSLASTNYYLDVVRAAGFMLGSVGPNTASSYEATMANVRPTAISLGGLTVTFATNPLTSALAGDLSEVQPGDLLRFADQSEWPMLPEEFHTTLAQACAARICLHQGRNAQAKNLSDLTASDIARYKSTLAPRVRADAPAIPIMATMLRRGW